MSFECDRYSSEALTDDDLTDAIGQLSGVMTGAHRHLLGFVHTYANRMAWHADGARNMAEWLAARLNIPYPEAKRWVRVAAELPKLPAIAAAFEAGRLNFAQVSFLIRIATPDTDEALAEDAVGRSVAELEQMARRSEPPVDEGSAIDAKKSLTWRTSPDGHRVKGNFDLPAVDGFGLIRRIEAEVERMPEQGYTGSRDPYSYRCAEALLALARTEPSERLTRATVVIHADASFVTGEGGSAEVEEGPLLCRESLCRYLCDCEIETIVAKPDGSLGIGRKSRSIPRWLERRIRRRDGGCRFPGCGLNRWTEIHHMRTWKADLGPTDEPNLITLCVFHHHFLHEHRWKVRGDPNGVLEFMNGGCAMKNGPPPLRPGLLAA